MLSQWNKPADLSSEIQQDLYEIQVFIDGRVKEPGLYRLRKGALIADLWEMAKPLEDGDVGISSEDFII
jgi:hypothetical protein